MSSTELWSNFKTGAHFTYSFQGVLGLVWPFHCTKYKNGLKFSILFYSQSFPWRSVPNFRKLWQLCVELLAIRRQHEQLQLFKNISFGISQTLSLASLKLRFLLVKTHGTEPLCFRSSPSWWQPCRIDDPKAFKRSIITYWTVQDSFIVLIRLKLTRKVDFYSISK